MTLKRLMFPKCLVTRWIGRATESIVSLMGLFMPSQTCCCEKALITSFPFAFESSLFGMGTFDVLLEVFIFNV